MLAANTGPAHNARCNMLRPFRRCCRLRCSCLIPPCPLCSAASHWLPCCRPPRSCRCQKGRRPRAKSQGQVRCLPGRKPEVEQAAEQREGRAQLRDVRKVGAALEQPHNQPRPERPLDRVQCEHGLSLHQVTLMPRAVAASKIEPQCEYLRQRHFQA
jgi:hypothetical protein